jgi:hypothetical protein
MRKLYRLTAGAAVVALAAIIAITIGSGVFAKATETGPLLFTEDGSRAGGNATLVRDEERGTISAKINATHLEPGQAYTYWWIIFNDPGQCLEPSACSDADVFVDPEDHGAGFNFAQIEAVRVAALGGNGQVANNGGRAQFTGVLYENSPLPHDVAIGPGGIFDFGHGWLLEDAMEAQIIIVLRNHGPALSGAGLAEQLHTFAGNCGPPPFEGCSEPQFAMPR